MLDLWLKRTECRGWSLHIQAHPTKLHNVNPKFNKKIKFNKNRTFSDKVQHCFIMKGKGMFLKK